MSIPPVMNARAKPAIDSHAATLIRTPPTWRTTSDAISRINAKTIGLRIESQIGSVKSTRVRCYRARSPADKRAPDATIVSALGDERGYS